MLVGPWAYDWVRFGKKICVNREKVQIIAKISPEELLQNIQSFVLGGTKFEVSMRQQHFKQNYQNHK